MKSVNYFSCNVSDFDSLVGCRNNFIKKNLNTTNNTAGINRIRFMPTYLYETCIYGAYKIILTGVRESGEKVNVILDNIEPYFELIILGNEDEFIREVLRILGSTDINAKSYIVNSNSNFNSTRPPKYIKPKRIGTKTAKTFKYYKPYMNKFLRLYFNNTFERKKAIEILEHPKNNTKYYFETTTNDVSCYYRVVCRDLLCTFSNWSYINNPSDYKSAFDKYNMWKIDTYSCDIANYTPCEDTDVAKADYTMSCCWDIETWSPDGSVPFVKNKEHKMICISMCFQWIHDKEPFKKFILSTLPSDENTADSITTIVCRDEIELITTFGAIFEAYKPEYIYGFNDSDYDWPWLINRAQQYNILHEFASLMDIEKNIADKNYEKDAFYTIEKNNSDKALEKNYTKYRCERVKIDAQSTASCYALHMNGYLPVDVRTIYRKLYPTDGESSLKYFLSKNKLGGKEDMEYSRMHNIFTRLLYLKNKYGFDKTGVDFDIKKTNPDFAEYQKLKTDMKEVNKYCIIDAVRCHELMHIRSVITEHREVSNLSYVSVYDAFYRANGLKVRNLTIAEGQQKPFNIRFSNITNTDFVDKKFSGALVFPPNKGLKISKLSIDERITRSRMYIKNQDTDYTDYADWENTTEEEIFTYKEFISQHGAYITDENILNSDICIKNEKFRKFLQEPTGRPIIGLDFSSLYPSLIRTYNFSQEYCITDDSKILEVLQADGVKLNKIEFTFDDKKIETYFIHHNCIYDKTDPNFKFGVYPYILNELFNKRAMIKGQLKPIANRIEELLLDEKNNTEQIAELTFQRNCLNSKQSALKVFMNTFYGETGNKLSPFFIVEIAGSVTHMGQYNLQLGYDTVKKLDCEVYYGDSVASYTPVLIMRNNIIEYVEIQNIIDELQYIKTIQGKEIFIFGETDNIYSWSDLGWTKINKIIRHKTDKQMYRVCTHSGIVDVTEDHSLLDVDGNIITPENAIGKKLLIKNHPNFKDCAHHTYSKIHKLLKSINFVRSAKTTNTSNCIVKKVIKLPQTLDYVYDLETENHHFSAGIGNIVVHNTDSLYISIPEKYFTAEDKQFYSGKIDKLSYWTSLVKSTFSNVNSIRDSVNKTLEEDNGTTFLTMAYEEILYPVLFASKKKYFGIKHEKHINFQPRNVDDLFIRGLEIRKRGVSMFAKQMIGDIMLTCVSPNNIYTLLELTFKKIDEIYANSTQYSYHLFNRTDVYRPNKKNVKVQTFASRMRELGIYVKPYERFNYVIVKKYPYRYDHKGRKSHILVGDKMEFTEYAEENKLEIDLDKYMIGSINGQLARLIAYHDKFYVEPADRTLVELKSAEDKIYKSACKYINEYCSQYYTSYYCLGAIHKKIYKEVHEKINSFISEKYPEMMEILDVCVDLDSDEFENELVSKIEGQIEKAIKNSSYGEDKVNKIFNTELEKNKLNINKKSDKEKIRKIKILIVEQLRVKYDAEYKQIEKSFEEDKSNLLYKIKNIKINIIKIYEQYRQILIKIIDEIKPYDKSNAIKSCDKLNVFITPFNGNSKEIDISYIENIDEKKLTKLTYKYSKEIILNYKDELLNLNSIYKNIMDLYISKLEIDNMIEYLKNYRNKEYKFNHKPPEVGMQIKNNIKEDVEIFDITDMQTMSIVK